MINKLNTKTTRVQEWKLFQQEESLEYCIGSVFPKGIDIDLLRDDEVHEMVDDGNLKNIAEPL